MLRASIVTDILLFRLLVDNMFRLCNVWSESQKPSHRKN